MATDDDEDTSEVCALVTDLIDPTQFTAVQATEADAQRWEIVTAFREGENGIRGGPAVALRSNSPDMIRQEPYALLCVYQVIRTLICNSTGEGRPGPRPDLLHLRQKRHRRPRQ